MKNGPTLHHCLFTFALALLFMSSTGWACTPINYVEAESCLNELKTISKERPNSAIETLSRWNFKELPPETALHAYTILSNLYNEAGQYQASRKTAELGISIAEKHEIKTSNAAVLMYNIGFAIEKSGSIEEASFWYKDGLEVAKTLNDLPTIIEGHLNVGAYYYYTERLHASLKEMIRALSLSKELEDTDENLELKGKISNELANLYGKMNKHKEALIYLYEASDYFQRIKRKELVLNSYSNIAMRHVLLGHFDQAETTYKRLLNASTGNAFERHRFLALFGLANLSIERKSYQSALNFTNKAFELTGAIEDRDLIIGLHLTQAKALMALKKFNESKAALEYAESLVNQMSEFSGKEQAVAIIKLHSELLYLQGNYQQAYQRHQTYVDELINLGQLTTSKVVEDLRIKYETEQSEAQNRALIAKQQQIEEAAYKKEIQMVILSFILIGLAGLIGYQFLLKRKLMIAATTDGLTRVMNRRYLSERATRVFHNSNSNNQPLSVIMLDVDHFKAINDNYGHQIGDQVLQAVSKVSKSAMREGDFFGRWGGEEFVAVMPGADDAAAEVVAKRIAKALSDYDWSQEGLDYQVTASIGVLSCHNTDEAKGFDCLVNQADAAMYQAKRGGRNRIVTTDWIALDDSTSSPNQDKNNTSPS